MRNVQEPLSCDPSFEVNSTYASYTPETFKRNEGFSPLRNRIVFRHSPTRSNLPSVRMPRRKSFTIPVPSSSFPAGSIAAMRSVVVPSRRVKPQSGYTNSVNGDAVAITLSCAETTRREESVTSAETV